MNLVCLLFCPRGGPLRSERRRVPAKRSAVRRFEVLESRLLLAATGWTARGAGGGGSLFSPSINPQNAAEMYIASDMGEIFHTVNQGAAWETLDSHCIQGSSDAPVRFTSDANIRYAIDHTSDVRRPVKSADGGKTWAALAGDPTDADAFNLFADYANPNRVLVADWMGLYLSNDGGKTFKTEYTTTDSGDGLAASGALFDGTHIYVGTRDGLLSSSDNGNSFQLASVGGIPSDQRIVSFAGAKENGTTRLWAVTLNAADVYGGIQGSDYGGYRGIFTLDVGQANWTPTTSGITAGADPFFVAAATNDIDTVYVGGGSQWGSPTVFKSTNGGVNWQDVFHTQGNQNIETGWSGDGGNRGWSYGEDAMGFAVNPLDPQQVIITDYGFAHGSINGGATWQVLNVVPADRNPAGTTIPLAKSYRSSGLDNTSVWDLAWVDPTHLVGAYTDIRGALSADGGQSWSFNYSGHTQNTMYRVIKHPANGVLYAATSTVHDMYESTYLTDSRIDGGGGRVISSSDAGHTWQVLHDFGHVVTWVEADPHNPHRLYASVAHSSQGGIYVTDDLQDGAASIWRKLATPPRTEGHAFNLRVLDDGTLVASYSARRNSSSAFTASSGVFVSSDGGQSWLDRSATGMKYWTKDIVIDPYDSLQNTWYAAVFSGWGGPPNGLGGLYRTTNRGLTWSRVFQTDSVNSITISPVNSNRAYLTSETQGLWYTEDLRDSSPVFTPVADYPFQQPMRVIYNPYDPTEIWATSFGNGLRVGHDGTQAGTITGTAASDKIRIVRRAPTSTLTDVFLNNDSLVPTYSSILAGISQWSIAGLEGDDTLVLDYSNGDPLGGGLSFEGGSSGNDTLVLQGLPGGAAPTLTADQVLLAGLATISYRHATVVLAGQNSYTGATTVNAGTLRIDSSTALPGSTSLVVNGGTVVLNTPSNQAVKVNGLRLVGLAPPATSGKVAAPATVQPATEATQSAVDPAATADLSEGTYSIPSVSGVSLPIAPRVAPPITVVQPSARRTASAVGHATVGSSGHPEHPGEEFALVEDIARAAQKISVQPASHHRHLQAIDQVLTTHMPRSSSWRPLAAEDRQSQLSVEAIVIQRRRWVAGTSVRRGLILSPPTSQEPRAILFDRWAW